ncbi:sterol desaturase family protein [Hoeflea alexandrii]|uniref:sterol desaturase family protein n=1 Tax=Hoeflea alexandrii TaxID=288436 RepID=UPI0022AF17F5|nr:sterol desaturase family protein [Hoeflea alexandrii]MCZ4291085.1 sterol desaturase family protein [Hoeflea alexandrii]
MEHALTEILSYLAAPLLTLLTVQGQYFWATYLGAALTAAAIYLVFRRGHRRSWRGLRAFVLPGRIFNHPSTRLDFKLYLVGTIYALVQGTVIFGALPHVLETSLAGLEALFGPGKTNGTPSHLLTAMTVFLSFLALEFGYWFSHWLMHRVDWLWEFHKVHHSAEVMTPLTEWRQHPVELFMFPALMGAAVALVHAPVIYLFGRESQTLALGGANAILVVFWYTVLHLRHSHIPFTLEGFWGRILQTPAHHQVHHSTDPRHFNRNLGYCLSLWDWLFGTLYVPRKDERFEFGLGERDEPLETLIGSLVAPFGRAASLIGRRMGLTRTAPPPGSAEGPVPAQETTLPGTSSARELSA